MLSRTLQPGRPLSLRETLSPLCHGAKDPCARFDADGNFWRTTRTPDGPATMHLRVAASEAKVAADAWGPGAGHALDGLAELIGEHQSDGEFESDHPVIRDLHRRHQGLRIPRTTAVFEALLPSILEQRVTGMEAKHSYASLVRRFGDPAPGPARDMGLMLAPRPDLLAETPYWSLHPMGIDRKRAETIRAAARVVRRLEETCSAPPAVARRRLLSVPGIGPWTAAESAMVALGDADAVSVGDFHIPNWVAWALAGEPRGDDQRMLELLEPFRGQRARVIRLISRGHSKPPKFGPRYSPLPIASF